MKRILTISLGEHKHSICFKGQTFHKHARKGMDSKQPYEHEVTQYH